MIIPNCSEIPIATREKESDPKKRIGRGIDIGRLRGSRPETILDTLKKEITPRPPVLRRMGFGAGKSLANRTRCSLSSYSAERAEIASTDTLSDVSVAVSQGRHQFATLSATDSQLIRAENVRGARRAKVGEGGMRS